MTDKHVLLTGATGFLGKVVLAELLRRREELGIGTIRLLVRNKKNKSPQARFMSEIASSPALGWANNGGGQVDMIRVAGCELAEPGARISDDDRRAIERETTHIIHCAASVEFDLPIARAASANISSSLEITKLAKGCDKLDAMVAVSTAYVTPHHGADKGPMTVTEQLAPLPEPAAAIYERILAGVADEDALKAASGLPNTYTLTKSVSEHMICEAREDLPLAILRPSIISSAWERPVPGWIDSNAAFAAFVTAIGSGHFRTLLADPGVRLDIVAVDEVADRIIECAFSGIARRGEPVAIRHSAAGIERACRVDTACEEIAGYFQQDPFDRYPQVHYVGKQGPRFALAELRHHRLRNRWQTLLSKLKKDKQRRKQARMVASRVAYLNRAFPYFTHHTFDFKTQFEPLENPCPGGPEYIRRVCRGAHEFLIKADLEQSSLAGKEHRHDKHDIAWALGQPRGNWAIRATGLVLRKAFRRCIDKVTFDRKSFEQAREAIPDDSFLVIVPSHRSYLDFLVCSYLFFERPDLEIAIPHIAAADEFRKIPLIGWLFKRTQAFYIRRGQGREDPQLTAQVHDLVSRNQTLQFFIEGTRSRSRQFMPPKRGLLRCLQATGQHCTILPLSISYDRLPEEGAFIEELRGGAKPSMSLKALLRWTGRLLRNKVHLGRIHLRCGAPQVLGAETDVHELSRRVVGQMQAAVVTTTHHLRAFVRHNELPPEITAEWLVEAIEARGGTVVESGLGDEETIDPVLERTLRYQWQHHFYPDAQLRVQNNPAIEGYINGTWYSADRPEEPTAPDPRVDALMEPLFKPVCDDYCKIGEALAQRRLRVDTFTVRELRRLVPTVHDPTVDAAIDDLVARGVISEEERGRYRFGEADALAAWTQSCRWSAQAEPVSSA